MRDPQVAARLLEDYEQDITDSDEISLDEWKAAAGRGRRSSARSCGSWSGNSDRGQVPAQARRRPDRDLQHPPVPRHGSPHDAVARRRRASARSNADVVALQEVIGAGPNGAGQAEEIGAALGMGWVMTSVRHLRNHLFGNVVLSRFPIVHHSQYRPVVADLRASRVPARRSRRRRRTAAAHLQRPPRHGGAGAPVPGDAAGGLRPRPAHRGAEGDPRRLQRMDAGAGDEDAQLPLRKHRHLRAPETPAHLPGHSSRCFTSITSITKGTSRSATRRARPLAQAAMMASDHLPLDRRPADRVRLNLTMRTTLELRIH